MIDNCNIYEPCDSGVIKEYFGIGEGTMEEPIVIKIYTGLSEGDPTKGIAKVATYTSEPCTALISGIGQSDIIMSGGIYQLGDIRVQLRKEIKVIDDATQCPGDRIVWRGHEYRPVGRIATTYMAGYVLWDYNFRRV